MIYKKLSPSEYSDQRKDAIRELGKKGLLQKIEQDHVLTDFNG